MFNGNLVIFYFTSSDMQKHAVMLLDDVCGSDSILFITFDMFLSMVIHSDDNGRCWDQQI